jgi:hypothetical protein
LVICIVVQQFVGCYKYEHHGHKVRPLAEFVDTQKKEILGKWKENVQPFLDKLHEHTQLCLEYKATVKSHYDAESESVLSAKDYLHNIIEESFNILHSSVQQKSSEQMLSLIQRGESLEKRAHSLQLLQQIITCTSTTSPSHWLAVAKKAEETHSK